MKGFLKIESKRPDLGGSGICLEATSSRKQGFQMVIHSETENHRQGLRCTPSLRMLTLLRCSSWPTHGFTNRWTRTRAGRCWFGRDLFFVTNGGGGSQTPDLGDVAFQGCWGSRDVIVGVAHLEQETSCVQASVAPVRACGVVLTTAVKHIDVRARHTTPTSSLQWLNST